jgi:hypothetical protein
MRRTVHTFLSLLIAALILLNAPLSTQTRTLTVIRNVYLRLDSSTEQAPIRLLRPATRVALLDAKAGGRLLLRPHGGGPGRMGLGEERHARRASDRTIRCSRTVPNRGRRGDRYCRLVAAGNRRNSHLRPACGSSSRFSMP